MKLFAEPIEFSLNNFRRIHWIMTQSKKEIFTKDALCQAIDIFPDELAKMKFLLLCLV